MIGRKKRGCEWWELDTYNSCDWVEMSVIRHLGRQARQADQSGRQPPPPSVSKKSWGPQLRPGRDQRQPLQPLGLGGKQWTNGRARNWLERVKRGGQLGPLTARSGEAES
jgi:hypothetical protein